MCAKFGVSGKCHTEIELKLYYFAASKALPILHYCVWRDAKPTQAAKKAFPEGLLPTQQSGIY
jgi:hypothetical protein